MSENVFLMNEDGKGIQQSEFLLATIVTADGSAGTATILLDGMTAANVKPYKALVSAWPLAQGDRVVVMKLSGTYLIVGKIGNAPSTDYEPAFNVLSISKGGTGQSRVTTTSGTASIITAGTGVSIFGAYFKKWGHLGHLLLHGTATAAAVSSSTAAIGTLLPAFRPIETVIYAENYRGKSGAIYSGTGAITLNENITSTSGSLFMIGVSYLLEKG